MVFFTNFIFFNIFAYCVRQFHQANVHVPKSKEMRHYYNIQCILEETGLHL